MSGTIKDISIKKQWPIQVHYTAGYEETERIWLPYLALQIWIIVEKGLVEERALEFRDLRKFSPRLVLPKISGVPSSKFPGEENLDLLLLGSPTTMREISERFKRTKIVKIFREFRQNLRKISFIEYKDTFLSKYTVIRPHKYTALIREVLIKDFKEKIEKDENIIEYNLFIEKREKFIDLIKQQIIDIFSIPKHLLDDEDHSDILSLISAPIKKKLPVPEPSVDQVVTPISEELPVPELPVDQVVTPISEELPVPELPVDQVVTPISEELPISDVDFIDDLITGSEIEGAISDQEEDYIERTILEKEPVDEFKLLVSRNRSLVVEIYQLLQTGGRIKVFAYSQKKGIGRLRVGRALELIKKQVRGITGNDLIKSQLDKKMEVTYLQTKESMSISDEYLLDDHEGLYAFLLESEFFYDNLLISADMIASGMQLEKKVVIEAMVDLTRRTSLEIICKGEQEKRYFVSKKQLNQLPPFDELEHFEVPYNQNIANQSPVEPELQKSPTTRFCIDCDYSIQKLELVRKNHTKAARKIISFCPRTHRILSDTSKACEKFEKHESKTEIYKSCNYCTHSILESRGRKKFRALCAFPAKIHKERYLKIRNTLRTGRSCELFVRR